MKIKDILTEVLYNVYNDIPQHKQDERQLKYPGSRPYELRFVPQTMNSASGSKMGIRLINIDQYYTKNDQLILDRLNNTGILDLTKLQHNLRVFHSYTLETKKKDGQQDTKEFMSAIKNRGQLRASERPSYMEDTDIADVINSGVSKIFNPTLRYGQINKNHVKPLFNKDIHSMTKSDIDFQIRQLGHTFSRLRSNKNPIIIVPIPSSHDLCSKIATEFARQYGAERVYMMDKLIKVPAKFFEHPELNRENEIVSMKDLYTHYKFGYHGLDKKLDKFFEFNLKTPELNELRQRVKNSTIILIDDNIKGSGTMAVAAKTIYLNGLQPKEIYGYCLHFYN